MYGILHTGYISNLKLRFERHIKILAESVKDRRLLKLIYYEAYSNLI